MRASGPDFIDKHIKTKAIFMTKMTPPHGQANSFLIPSIKSSKQNTSTAICLISMFTDAHLHYAAFELLKSVDSQTTNLQLKFLPCNLLVKHGTSQLTTILLSHPSILGVTLCFCTGSYAAAAAGRRFLFTR